MKKKNIEDRKAEEVLVITWQMLDVGGQQFGFLLLISLLRDVT